MHSRLTARGRHLRGMTVKILVWTVGVPFALWWIAHTIHPVGAGDQPISNSSTVTAGWSPVRQVSNESPVYTPPVVAPLSGMCSVIRPTVVHVGDPVTFSVNVSGGTGSYTYTWSGTDGLSGTSSSVTTTYPTDGDKMAMVTVFSNGQSLILSRSVYVERALPSVVPSEQEVQYPLSSSADNAGYSSEYAASLNNRTLSWATHRLVAKTGWEPSYRDAQIAGWRALRTRVMALPLDHGQTIADAARQTPGLGDRINRAIPIYTRMTRVEYLPAAAVRLQMTLDLRNVAQIVQLRI